MKMKVILNIGVAAFTTIAFAACGKDDNNSGGSGSGNQQPASPSARILVADLAPLNPNFTLSKTQKGTAVVSIVGDKIDVLVSATSLDPSLMHMGHIHKGDRCPNTVTDDVNGDGVMDVVEGIPAYGAILVDFGADISSFASAQKGGDPTADAMGMVNYRGTGSFQSLVDDLHNRPELPPATGVGKLAVNEPFVAEMGVIVIHGIFPATALPATVASVTGLSPQESIPVLCGRLRLQGTVNPAPSIGVPNATPVPIMTPAI